MTAPVPFVEFGFGSTWQTEPASITWEPVTSYVLRQPGITTRRGASSVSGSVDVGTLDFVLDNRDRRFDPLHTTGPYYGDLKPGVPVRVTAAINSENLVWDTDDLYWDVDQLIWSGGTAGVWYGSVAKWPQRFELGDRFASVPVAAWDGFDKLSRAKIPRSVMEAVIMPLNPIGYWPLNDPAGSTTATDVVGANFGTAADEPVFGSDELAPGLGSSVEFDGVNDRIDLSRSPLWDFATSWTIIAVIRTDTAAEASSEHPIILQIAGTTSSSNLDGVFVHTDGKINRYAYGSAVVESASAVSDGETHLIIACRDLLGVNYGVAVDSATLNTSTVSGFAQSGNGVAIGGTPYAADGYDDNFFVGSISHVAVFEAALNSTQRQAIVDAYSGLAGQTTDERIGWILDELDWPTNLRNLETGRSFLGAATFKPGDNALEYLRLVTASEDGLLFTTADGTLRFLDRYWRYLDTLATTSQFTFTDQNTSKSYAVFDLDLDDELLVNTARLTRRDGTEQVAVDATSRDTYGEAELKVDNLLLRTDNEVLSLAQWKVLTGATPLPRVPTIRVPLHRYSTADQQTVLELDLGHRVTCVRTPPTGSAISLDFQITGISNTIAGTEWWWEAYVSPVPEDTATLFTLGTSELGGVDVMAY